MSHIEAVGQFTFSKDNVARIKAIIDDCIKSTIANDKGTLQYDWLINDDETEIVVREKYQNSDSLLNHVGHVSEYMSQLQLLASVDIYIVGAPSSDLKQALDSMGIKVFQKFAGL